LGVVRHSDPHKPLRGF